MFDDNSQDFCKGLVKTEQYPIEPRLGKVRKIMFLIILQNDETHKILCFVSQEIFRNNKEVVRSYLDKPNSMNS